MDISQPVNEAGEAPPPGDPGVAPDRTSQQALERDARIAKRAEAKEVAELELARAQIKQMEADKLADAEKQVQEERLRSQ